jgi:endonuclease YncB( thermonuclease family)
MKYSLIYRIIILISFTILINIGCERKTQHNSTENENQSFRVVKIIDGDTYDILDDNNTQTRIRIYGIDAPERGMPYYKVSKNYLGELTKGNKITIEIKDKDRYGRIVAKGYLPNGDDIGLELIKAGVAWHFKKYSNDMEYAEAEINAKQKKLGLWKEPNPTPPWENRKRKRKN